MYNESLEIEQQITPLNEHNVTNSYNNISVVYDNFNDYSRPFYYHKKALKIYQREQCLDLSICNRAVIYNNTSEQSSPANHPTLVQRKKDLERVKLNLGSVLKMLSGTCYDVTVGNTYIVARE